MERVVPLLRDPVQVSVRVREPLRLQLPDAFSPLAATTDQAGLREHLKVLEERSAACFHTWRTTGGGGVAAAPLWVRVFYALQRRRHGVVLEPTRVWARAPAPLRGFPHLAAAVDRRGSPIEPAFRPLVTVKVSQVNSCSFCVDLNAARLQQRGVGMDKAMALSHYETSDLFSSKERAALDYAVAMTRTGKGVDHELFSGRVRPDRVRLPLERLEVRPGRCEASQGIETPRVRSLREPRNCRR